MCIVSSRITAAKAGTIILDDNEAILNLVQRETHLRGLRCHARAGRHAGVGECAQEALKQEEELQLQLATRESLAPPLHSHAEALSFKYWSTGRCAVQAAVPLLQCPCHC